VKRAFLSAVILFAVVLSALAVHAPSLTYGFVFDEQLLIVANPAVHDLREVKTILLSKFWPGPMAGIYYRPIITLSYALNYSFAGPRPGIYHLTNVLAHAAGCGLLYLLLLRLGATLTVVGPTALLFAVHPALSESVDWVPGRTDLFAGLFMATAWLTLLLARSQKAQKRLALYLPALLLYLLALGSKETAIVLPALIVLHDLLLQGRAASRYKYEYAGIFLAVFGFLLLRQHVLDLPGLAPPPSPRNA
jgi:hypothetical protein